MIQVASDIHLEFYDDSNPELFLRFVKPSAPYLALLGDIGYPTSRIYFDFLKYCSENFEQVLLISGNHEYYDCLKNLLTMKEIDLEIEKICSQLGNVHYLNNSTYELDNILFIGTTLWSEMDDEDKQFQAGLFVNDYKYTIVDFEQGCNYLGPSMVNLLFARNVRFLIETIENNLDREIVILSHHLPTFSAIDPKYYSNPVNFAYASELDWMFYQYPIKMWLFGHTHSPVRIKVSKTKLHCNPVGYNKQNGEFQNEEYHNDYVV